VIPLACASAHAWIDARGEWPHALAEPVGYSILATDRAYREGQVLPARELLDAITFERRRRTGQPHYYAAALASGGVEIVATLGRAEVGSVEAAELARACPAGCMLIVGAGLPLEIGANVEIDAAGAIIGGAS